MEEGDSVIVIWWMGHLGPSEEAEEGGQQRGEMLAPRPSATDTIYHLGGYSLDIPLCHFG